MPRSRTRSELCGLRCEKQFNLNNISYTVDREVFAEKQRLKWGTWGAVGGRRLRRPGAARARACDGRLRGAAPGGRLRARLAARRGCGGISCAPIAGAGGVRCGRPGLVRLAAAGRAPRLRRAGGGGVTAGRVRFPVRRRAALVGGGIAAAPKVHTGGTRHGKHAPPAGKNPLMHQTKIPFMHQDDFRIFSCSKSTTRAPNLCEGPMF